MSCRTISVNMKMRNYISVQYKKATISHINSEYRRLMLVMVLDVTFHKTSGDWTSSPKYIEF